MAGLTEYTSQRPLGVLSAAPLELLVNSVPDSVSASPIPEALSKAPVLMLTAPALVIETAPPVWVIPARVKVGTALFRMTDPLPEFVAWKVLTWFVPFSVVPADEVVVKIAVWMTPDTPSAIDLPVPPARVTFPVVRIDVPTAPVPFNAMSPPAVMLMSPPATEANGEPMRAAPTLPGVNVTFPLLLIVIVVVWPPAPLEPIAATEPLPPVNTTSPPVVVSVRIVGPGVAPPIPPIREPAKFPVAPPPVIATLDAVIVCVSAWIVAALSTPLAPPNS